MSHKLQAGGWVVIVPLTGVLAAYLYFIFFPGMRTMREEQAEMVTKRAYLAQSAARTARLEAAEKEAAATIEYLRQWRGTATKSSDVARLFGDLSECLKQSGATTTVFRPEAKQPSAVVDRVPLTVACVGTFTQLQSMLASIESLPQRIWIEEAIFERDAKDGEKMRAELKPVIFVNNFEISD
jgi:Tfp pilus assembly protein PilO